MSHQTALNYLHKTFVGETPEVDQADLYPEFSQIMGIYNYTWEPIEVTTEDGYTLTMMRVTGRRVPPGPG